MNARLVSVQALVALASLGLAVMVWADTAGAHPSVASRSGSLPAHHTGFSIDASAPFTTPTAIRTGTYTPTPTFSPTRTATATSSPTSIVDLSGHLCWWATRPSAVLRMTTQA